MASITCEVIDARDGRPVMGMQVMLKSVNQPDNKKRSFKGRTAFDGQVHLWYPEGDKDRLMLDDLIQSLALLPDHRSMWQMGFDTLGFFGPEVSCWPVLDVLFYLTWRESWTYHVSVVLGPYDYKTSVTMRPIMHTGHFVHRRGQQPQEKQLEDYDEIMAGQTQGETIPENHNRVPHKRTKQLLTPQQRTILRQEYAITAYPGPLEYNRISSDLGISKKKVRTWYASERARDRHAHVLASQEQERSRTPLEQRDTFCIDPTLLFEGRDGSSPASASAPLTPASREMLVYANLALEGTMNSGTRGSEMYEDDNRPYLAMEAEDDVLGISDDEGNESPTKPCTRSKRVGRERKCKGKLEQ